MNSLFFLLTIFCMQQNSRILMIYVKRRCFTTKV